MSETIQDVIEFAQAAVLAADTRIKAAPDYPTANAAVHRISSIAYADNISLESQGTFDLIFFELVIDIRTTATELDKAMERLAGIPEKVMAALAADQTFGGNAQTYGGAITCRLLQSTEAAQPLILYQVRVPRIKMKP